LPAIPTQHHAAVTKNRVLFGTKGPPAKDPAQTASLLKTWSSNLLVDAIGTENIALGLDSNLTRVAELVNGERFTPETAFHMDMKLGLPDGFFDQPNPVLTPETIARLKSPLDHIHAGKPLPLRLLDQVRRARERGFFFA
jgi:hypothetical protein